MNFIKENIQKNIVNPTNRLFITTTVIGIITKSDEINNICSVLYIDKDGFERNKENVRVKISDKADAWFPNVDEQVLLKDDGTNLIIFSPYIVNYNVQVRAKNELSEDIYSDSFGASIGGTII